MGWVMPNISIRPPLCIKYASRVFEFGLVCDTATACSFAVQWCIRVVPVWGETLLQFVCRRTVDKRHATLASVPCQSLMHVPPSFSKLPFPRPSTRVVSLFLRRRCPMSRQHRSGVISPPGSVSNVEMVTPIALIYKVLFPSISTFETPPMIRSSNAPTRRVLTPSERAAPGPTHGKSRACCDAMSGRVIQRGSAVRPTRRPDCPPRRSRGRATTCWPAPDWTSKRSSPLSFD